MVRVFSPSAFMSVTERSARPIRRWISWVRPDCLPSAASRRPRVWVARGSMPYSPVTQPSPLPFFQRGTSPAQLAVHSTWVCPNFARHEPSAYRLAPGSREIERSWVGLRPEGLMKSGLSSGTRWFWVVETRVHHPYVPPAMTATPPIRPASSPAASSAAFAAMDRRSRDIFREIVQAYLDTGEPVGSRTISRRGVALSPASIRNIMSDLAEMGLIDSPHTSAGRVPTHAGLRIFVDSLMQLGDPAEGDKRAIEARLGGSGRRMENVLSEASELLSGLVGGAGLVSTPAADAPIRHVEFVRISAEQALAVIVAESGDVENRVLALPPGLPASALIEAGNYLNARMKGRTLAEAREFVLDEIRSRTRRAGRRNRPAGRGRDGAVVGRGPFARPVADRARPRQPAGGHKRRRGPRTRAQSVRRTGAVREPAERARHGARGRGRPAVHRLGEPAVFAVGFGDDRRPLYECGAKDCRGAWA